MQEIPNKSHFAVKLGVALILSVKVLEINPRNSGSLDSSWKESNSLRHGNAKRSQDITSSLFHPSTSCKVIPNGRRFLKQLLIETWRRFHRPTQGRRPRFFRRSQSRVLLQPLRTFLWKYSPRLYSFVLFFFFNFFKQKFFLSQEGKMSHLEEISFQISKFQSWDFANIFRKWFWLKYILY